MRRLSVLAALLLACGAAAAQAPGLTPLNEMGPAAYLGFTGGLYPNQIDSMPVAHAAAGAAHAVQIQPLDTSGNPDPAGRIALVSIGMSNTTQEFCSAGGRTPCASWSFVGQAILDPEVDHTTLALVNGARAGQTASTWDSPTDPNYDRIRDLDLAEQGLTEAQVQVAWVKVANAVPTFSLPAANADAYTLVTQMGDIVRALRVRYPNLQLVFLSSRIYAGYATTMLNPEPYAYEYGFSVKWIVQAQIDQMSNGGVIVNPLAGDLNYDTGAPWIAWGPYLWGNGSGPRCDGLAWLPGDFQSDGTHPSQSGEQKVGTMLLDFFKADPRARDWFLALGDIAVSPTSGLAAGGASIAVTGVGFQPGATLTVGGVGASNVVVTPSQITATTPGLSPATLHDVAIVNPGGSAGTIPEGFFADFLDVPQPHLFHDEVETLRRSDVTAGCADGIFCPDDPVTRGQLAVFLIRSRFGVCYLPPPATGQVFTDVPVSHFAADDIEELFSLGITSGCDTNPLRYCPDDPVTRAQSAILLLRARFGAGHVPPLAVGIFADVPVGSFGDGFIEELHVLGITSGCAVNPLLYCPDDSVTRGSMAAFLVRTFGLI